MPDYAGRAGEIVDRILDRIARTVWEVTFIDDPGGPPAFPTEGEEHEAVMGVAFNVWADLDIQRVPTLAISRTEEHIEGVPFNVHRKVGDPFSGDESICSQHEPVFRLRGLFGRHSEDGER